MFLFVSQLFSDILLSVYSVLGLRSLSIRSRFVSRHPMRFVSALFFLLVVTSCSLFDNRASVSPLVAMRGVGTKCVRPCAKFPEKFSSGKFSGERHADSRRGLAGQLSGDGENDARKGGRSAGVHVSSTAARFRKSRRTTS